MLHQTIDLYLSIYSRVSVWQKFRQKKANPVVASKRERKFFRGKTPLRQGELPHKLCLPR
jgi:hypothetical protein